MQELLREIRCCEVCRDHLELGPKPIFTAGSGSKLLIIGQAPGKKVHASGIPWDDKSGENLRNWLDIDRKTFYDTTMVSIVPMGFCYPGTGNSGDLPPRKECAPLWHDRLFRQMQSVKLTLLVGAYAQRH